jgi:hypothetical protein
MMAAIGMSQSGRPDGRRIARLAAAIASARSESTMVRYDANRGLDEYEWLGFRDKQLFAMRRSSWTAALSDPATTHLIFTGPHALTPDELIPALRGDHQTGVKFEKRLGIDKRWAEIFVVDPGAVGAASQMPLHLSPETAGAWLDMAADATAVATQEQQLIEVRPVLVGRGARALLTRIAPAACLVPAAEGRDAVSLVPRDDPDASRPGAVCD